ncbi:hypothetical protein WAE61_09000 [Comamonadaceae bacterium PP-2]
MNIACQCTQETKVRKIKVEENGKSAVLLNPDGKMHHKVQVDGCLLKQQTACDWYIRSVQNDENEWMVLIELKGRDVEHALNQIDSTVKYLQNENRFKGVSRWSALIVCSKVPKSPKYDSRLQNIQSKFAQKYKAPIHIVNGIYEYIPESLLSFGSPLRK